MMNIKLVYFTFLFLFQNSPFFCQGSGMEFDREQGFWTIGVQYGNSYQWSDVDSEVDGWGTGITFGKNLLFRENALLSLDLRSRIYFGISKGLDGVANANIAGNDVLNGNGDYNYLSEPGYFFNNFKSSFLGLDLETNLLLNRFRNRTGWFVNFFGGGGLGLYSTRMNLSDATGDYGTRFSAINQNQSSREIKKELRTVLDDSYESYADGFQKRGVKAGFMPSAGFEIGYDINRFLTAYMGHRTLFSRVDGMDGNELGNPNQDLLNFTHVGLQINFMKGNKKSRSRAVSTAGFESNPMGLIDDPEHGFPLVEITYPEVDWFNTSKGEMEVLAKIQNVYSILDISCMVNGKEVAFEYDKDEVKFYAYFQRGTNVLKVQVRNEKGEARDIKRVIFSPVENEGKTQIDPAFAKPSIELVSPANASFYAPEDVFTIQAYIENVESKDDVKLVANGMELNTFKFDPSFGNLSIKVRLAKGTNKFLLTAYNGSGKSEQEFFIFFGVDPEEEVVVGDDNGRQEKPVDEGFPPIETNTKPYISLLKPASNPFYTMQDEVYFEAELHGVEQKEDIEFTINGRRNYFFNFSENNKILSDNIQLMDKETDVVLVVKNEFGSDTKTLSIIYGEPSSAPETAQAKPLIEITEVGQPDDDCFMTLEASIREPLQKEQLHITLNDFEIRNYRYVPKEQFLRLSLYLDEGNNRITISATVAENTESASLNVPCGTTDYNPDDNDLEDTPVVDTSPAVLSFIQPLSPYVTEEQDVILRFRAGHVYDEEDVMIFLNDEIVDIYDFDPVKFEVQCMLSLMPKDNRILIRVSNAYGSDEKELSYYYDVPFKTAPTVVINSPRNGFTTDETTVVFRASVNYVKSIGDVSVFFNDEIFTDFTYNEEYGKIQAYLPLKLGNNTLEVIATNKIGSSSEKTRFQYKLDHVPAVEITGPKEGLEYRKSFAMLIGVVQNMPDKRGIGIQINGKPFQSINFDNENDLVSSRIILEKGENEIVLSAKNEYGFASDTIRLFFRGVPEKPSIVFITPNETGTQTTDSDFTLEAKVTEISHSTHVEVTVNGRSVEDVFYFKDEQLIRAEFRLKKGTNDIKLVATNETGTTTARTNIYLK